MTGGRGDRRRITTSLTTSSTSEERKLERKRVFAQVSQA
jgi:hypothetical protein